MPSLCSTLLHLYLSLQTRKDWRGGQKSFFLFCVFERLECDENPVVLPPRVVYEELYLLQTVHYLVASRHAVEISTRRLRQETTRRGRNGDPEVLPFQGSTAPILAHHWENYQNSGSATAHYRQKASGKVAPFPCSDEDSIALAGLREVQDLPFVRHPNQSFFFARRLAPFFSLCSVL